MTAYATGVLSDDQPEPRQTAAAIALTEVMRRVTVITKDKEVKEGRPFKFRGVDDVMNVVGPILREIGLLCLPEMVHDESVQVEYGRDRKIGYRTRVHMRYHLIGPDGSELIVGPVLGESIDGSDKGGSQAQSVAYRDFWLRTLCVPTGEPEPEHSSHEPARPEAGYTDPVVEKKLRDKITQAAGSLEKLRDCYKAVQAEFGGDKATITQETRNELQRLIKTEVDKITGQAVTAAAADEDMTQQRGAT